MKCHQILTGACNSGDRCFAVGSVEGVPFTAYAAGCNIVILANTFERVQVIPGVCHDNIQISCVDCSSDTGKIAAAYGKLVCIFEPTPLLLPNSSSHRLDYRWIQTGSIEAKCYINTLSWNLEGTRILTAGDCLEMWANPSTPTEEGSGNTKVRFDLEDEPDWHWKSIWECSTATSVTTLAFSPDGTLFATCSNNDRLVKVWYDNKLILSPYKNNEAGTSSNSESTRNSLSYGYIYLPHPNAVTGFTWRATSKYMPKGSVSNILLTSCRDNICRVWSETVLPDDGLVSLPHIDPVAAQNPRFMMHRHKHKFMQRLKLIKTNFHLRRNAKNGGISVNNLQNGVTKPSDPIPSLPSMFSIHDFHMYGIHGSGITPGFHFHLAATINAETDIPLVPSINSVSEQNFVIHWLNNKEIFFTSEAENILLEVSKRALDKDVSSLDPYSYDVEENRGKPFKASRPPSHMAMRGKSFDEEDVQSQHSMKSSHHPLSNATSTTSIATDATSGNATALGDALDRRIETLLRDWLQTSDMLFSIHPVDGSLLVWILDFLDGQQGAFRQAQVSFCARLPNALPLGDAMTMSPNLITYNGTTPYFLKTLIKIESQLLDEEKSKCKSKTNLTLSSSDELDIGQGNTSSTPVICMTTKHSNGSLNLWHLSVAEDSRFTQILNISHFTRVCGHRFQINDMKCHPVLPLLLTTSHHNRQCDPNPSNNPPSSNTAADETPIICIQENTAYKDWCSELILWRVDAVGPLNKSGGVTELTRINSPQVSSFSNAAWIPILLPSTTLGRVSNSPSACFVASDGESLRVYQAVIDGRALLAEISTAERKKRDMEQTLSLSTDSSLQEHAGQVNLSDIFNVVSEQSTSRPGCIIQLDAIVDATHDWQNTLFLHVFQEGLIRGEKNTSSDPEKCIFDGDHSAIVDLHSKAVFEEPFYVTLIEKTENGAVMHMWRLIIASEHHDDETVLDETDPQSIPEMPQKGSHTEASPVIISTTKMYCKPLPLPLGVEVVHCCPAAGHLSSASIYPACFAPYLLVTACSDNIVRFWRCRMKGEADELTIEWQEWALINKQRDSSIKVEGNLIHVNAAYSGRIAVAFQRSEESCVSLSPGGSLVFSCMVSIYECESTGGSEWIKSDTIELKDVVVNQNGLSHENIDISYLHQLAEKRTKIKTAFSTEDLSQSTSLPNEQRSSLALNTVSSQIHVPSLSTLQSIKSNRFDYPIVNLKQKHPVQLGWLSMEDGSHLLTVAIGSKILVYTCVSEDLIQVSNSVPSDKRARPVLQKSVSMHQMSLEVLPRWLRLEKFSLQTADQLAPLPMQIAWVRDGILVIGMDNEMQVCSQWPSIELDNEICDTSFETKNRTLSQSQIKNVLRESPSYLKSAASMSRITSYSVLQNLDAKMKKGLGQILENPVDDIDEFSYTGIFEASRIASPILPQYHPRQLMELLNSGKIRRVKAIIAHLVRCLMSLGQQSSDPLNRTSVSDYDDNRKSWPRSRTLSATIAPPGPSLRENRNSLSLNPEEINLESIEIKAIPPLPLWLLLEADKEKLQLLTASNDTKEETYAELFGPIPNVTMEAEEELILGDVDDVDTSLRRKSLTQENKGIGFFGPRQAQCLAGLLTHTSLPGLSSMDQMHLLALADTVASCNVDFADRFDINKAKEAMAKETYSRSATDEPSMDSLDDCGLRFLLAMRQRTYLMRCLPIGQRAVLQKAGVGCHNIVWAFHSESQEELLDFIPAVRHGNIRWSELRELGAGWWIRSNTVLSTVILKVAKAAFLARNNPLDAAIYYLAMQKKSLVWGLFRSISDRKMTEFFANNFTEERWRKAALKNAFALMGKQRFEHAAAFFLLAGALQDAIEVVLHKLHDEQLAFVIIRLNEGELDATPNSLCQLLYTKFLGCDEEGNNLLLSKCHPDPFYRSLAYWTLKDYNNSLNTLLLSDQLVGNLHPEYEAKKYKSLVTADPNVFNFYIYLRTHPLLIRQCIANSAKDSTDAFMVARLGGGQDNLDKKSLYESTMTPLERRLYFTTASAHLCSGCPTLALEVLSKLPDNVIDLSNPDSEDLLGSPVKGKRSGLELIKSGTLDEGTSFEISPKSSGAASLFATDTSKGMDWSSPAGFGRVEEELQLDFTINDDEDDDTSSNDDANNSLTKEQNNGKHLDIMAQQLKFICCLKMMMEELATLATGCEVDGGQFRYQFYIWLEREVDALKEVCNYRNSLNLSETDLSDNPDEDDVMKSPSPAPFADQPATLHEILMQENVEFEVKRKKAVQRKRWLIANQQLLRTLLSYCSLHGSSGGGLASVRMELILLLQELQQENNKQQLLAPLPLPTTLPLLSASIASNKTVVVDPVRHLQCATHDLLQSLIEIPSMAIPSVELMTLSLVFRNLSAALSACIYQSVCDSENIALKNQPRVAALGLDLQQVGISIAYKESHLLSRETRNFYQEKEQSMICTPPSKWPGVSSLLTLVNQEKDEDTPRLNVLLCESFVSIYLCLLVHGLASSDPYVLYRLVSVNFNEKDWGILFGGGIRKVIKVITNAMPPTPSAEKEPSPAVAGERLLSTISNLQKTRIKLNMKFLGQLGFQDPRSSVAEGDTKSGTREQFWPPELSIISFLMTKPVLPNECENIDYDSSESDVEDIELDEEEDEDVFKEPKVYIENTEHSNTNSYSWCLLRLVCVRRAQYVVAKFLEVAEVDLQGKEKELAVTSPLLHAVMRTLNSWTTSLVNHIEEMKGPPPEYIPGCFAQSNVTGPAILKYKALLEPHNTPFVRNKCDVKPVSRLWNYLVRQEIVQGDFVRYIFGRKRPTPPMPPINYGDGGGEDVTSDSGDADGMEVASVDIQQEPSEGGNQHSESSLPPLEPVKVIHKEQDSISSFCINKVKPNLLAIATLKEVQELDISLLLNHPSWLTNECELDVLSLNQDPDSILHPNFLVVQTPMDKTFLEGRGMDSSSFANATSSPSGNSSQTGRGSTVLKDLKGAHFPGSTNPRFLRFVLERSKHYLKPLISYKLEGSRRTDSHPVLPLYLVGCQDGSVVVREWKHSQVVSQPRLGGTFAKVTGVRFNQQGNKFGVIDGDGHLSLFHLGMLSQTNAPFFTHQCHNKHGNDFTYVGSSSLIATAGQSSEHKNVALWDTLMPQRKSNIVSWNCHDHGASAVVYAPQHQVLISAGKKGQVCIFDVRQRTLRHKFQAHETAIKCMALDINEDFFVSGSADGDMKVWGLSVHNLLYNLPGEHSRTSLFKNLSQGVTNMWLDSNNHLFSCGADGSVKMRSLPERDLSML